ncbi:MAG: serine/threonine protein kinase [Planctomycetia bacterium]|nr:serine/threonine protein kinase [Planctomycetia bacterium]
MLALGTLFAGRYRIDQEIGRGSFGIVYRVLDCETERSVALKVLLPEADADPTLRHRLRREAKLANEMRSTHCIRVLDVAETGEGRTYVVMELLAGEELTLRMAREGRVAPAAAVEIASQVLEAVGEAHELGVVHRDLKPHNIFLCGGNGAPLDVKVLDFGIAKVAGRADGGGLSESARLTVHGNVLGTPTYMSPEQCRGDFPAPTSDIYSLGVVLYEMLAGKPPFDDPNPVQVLVKHNTEAVPPLPSDVARLPIGAATLRALEKDPELRFQSAAEFAAALSAMPPGQAGESTPQPEAKSDPAKNPEAGAPTTIAVRLSTIMRGWNGDDDSSASGPVRRGPSRAVLIGVCVLLALVVAIAVALKGGS